MNYPVILVTVETDRLLPAVRRYELDLQAGLNSGVDKLLNVVEATQIHKYSANAGPPKPSGSGYERTFTLRRASRKVRMSYILPEISGEWSADPSIADYAEYVLGSTVDQAPVHRGRWLSLEEVTEQVGQIAPEILKEEIAAIRMA